jgi:hypothetical protein
VGKTAGRLGKSAGRAGEDGGEALDTLTAVLAGAVQAPAVPRSSAAL